MLRSSRVSRMLTQITDCAAETRSLAPASLRSLQSGSQQKTKLEIPKRRLDDTAKRVLVTTKKIVAGTMKRRFALSSSLNPCDAASLFQSATSRSSPAVRSWGGLGPRCVSGATSVGAPLIGVGSCGSLRSSDATRLL